MSKPRKSLTSPCRAQFFFHLLIFMLAGGVPFMPDVQAQGQSECENVVTDAQKLYEEGRFAPAITLLRVCLPDGVPEEQRVGAYRLLAHAYLAEDKPEEAREAIKSLFGVKRDYTCDPTQDSQPYCGMVEEVKAVLPVTMEEKLFGGKKKWLWIGGGVVGVGVAAILIAQSGGQAVEDPLPRPPDLP
jgi:hypothetical protein